MPCQLRHLHPHTQRNLLCPDRGALTQIFGGSAKPDRSAGLSAVITSDAVSSMAGLAAGNHVEASVLDYIGALVEATRESPDTRLGVLRIDDANFIGR